MPTYIALMRWTSQGSKSVRDSPSRLGKTAQNDNGEPDSPGQKPTDSALPQRIVRFDAIQTRPNADAYQEESDIIRAG